MRSWLIGTILFSLLFASPAFAAWPESWKRTGALAITDTGTTIVNITSGQNAFLSSPNAVADNDNSNAGLRLSGTHGHTVCFSTDRAVVGNGAGTLTVEVFWFPSNETDLNLYFLLDELTTTVPCVFDVPDGFLRIRASAAASTDGLIGVRANPHQAN